MVAVRGDSSPSKSRGFAFMRLRKECVGRDSYVSVTFVNNLERGLTQWVTVETMRAAVQEAVKSLHAVFD